MRFSASTATLSHTAYSESRSWVIMTTVSPSAARRSAISASKAAAPMGSSPAVGSSRNTTAGSMTSARASPARLRMPPESSDGYFSAASGARPTMRSFMAATSSMASGGRLVNSRRGTLMFSMTVSDENRAPS